MNEASDCLKKFKENEFVRIMFEKSGLTLDERLTALYLQSMKSDCFDQYKLRPLLNYPQGFLEDYEKYKSVDFDDRAELWRAILKKHLGYFKAKDEVEFHNASDFGFLHDMEKHFKKMGLLSQAETCRQRINEFSYEKAQI